MKLTVYIDILLIVNSIINYFLIKISSFIACFPISTKRIILTSCISSLFSLFIFAEVNNVFLILFYKTICLVLTVFISFGKHGTKKNLKHLFIFVAVNSLYTGIIQLFMRPGNFVYENNLFFYININPFLLVFCISAIWICIVVFEIIYDFKTPSELYRFEIFIGGRSIVLNGFYDTGFRVKDIVTHRAVMLCNLSYIMDLIPADILGFMDKRPDDYTATGKIIPVFYSDITSGGVLPGFRPDKIMYKEKELKNILIAVTDKQLSEDVRLIFGKEIFNMTGK